MTDQQTCPYPWCTREETVPCAQSGSTTTHYGPNTTITAGDDKLSVQLLGLPGYGPDAHDVYVEVTTTDLLPSGNHRTSATFLTPADTDELITALTTARAAVVG